MNNAANGANVILDTFSSLVTVGDPADLPQGVSPDCKDVTFTPGSVSTRPGLAKTFSTVLPGDIVYAKTFVKQNGDPTTLVIDDTGTLYREDVTGDAGVLVAIPPPLSPVINAAYEFTATAPTGDNLFTLDPQTPGVQPPSGTPTSTASLTITVNSASVTDSSGGSDTHPKIMLSPLLANITCGRNSVLSTTAYAPQFPSDGPSTVTMDLPWGTYLVSFAVSLASTGNFYNPVMPGPGTLDATVTLDDGYGNITTYPVSMSGGVRGQLFTESFDAGVDLWTPNLDPFGFTHWDTPQKFDPPWYLGSLTMNTFHTGSPNAGTITITNADGLNIYPFATDANGNGTLTFDPPLALDQNSTIATAGYIVHSSTFLVLNGTLASSPSVQQEQSSFVQPGTYARSASAFGREYFGFFNTADAGGAAAPAIWDGLNLSRLTQDGPGVGSTLQEQTLNVGISSITQPAAVGAVPGSSPITVDPTTINFFQNHSGIYNGQGAQTNTTPYTGGTSLIFQQQTANFPAQGYYPPGGRRSPVSQQQVDANGNWVGDTFFPETDIGGNPGFDANIQSTIQIATAGTYTFYVLADDTWIMFIDGATYVSGPQKGTATSKAGYTYIASRCQDVADSDQAWDKVVVNFPSAGSYPIEMGWSNWNEGSTCFLEVTYVQGNGPEPSGQTPIGSLIPVTPAAGTVTCSQADSTVTVVCPGPHPFGVGDYALLSGFSVAGYNGLSKVTSVPSSNTFTFEAATTGMSAGSGGVVAPVTATVVCDSAHGLLVGDGVTITGNSNNTFNSGYDNTGTTPEVVNPGQWTVKAVVNDNAFQFDALANSTTLGSGGTLSGGGLISPGIHKCVVCFELEDGSITAPSPSTQLNSTGSKKLSVYGIPIGPSNTVARILAFTAADGGNYFYIPTDVMGHQSTLGGQSSLVKIGTATRIPDNTTTQVTLDFSDASLLAATGIDIPGNNLFNQVTLGPVMGVTSYADRLVCWGEWNKLENFVNLGFDGGWSTNAPLGWLGYGSGRIVATNLRGYAWEITGDGTNNPSGMISQGAYQDQLNVPILAPRTWYRIRCWAQPSVNGGSGSLIADLYSPTVGTIATATINMASVPVSGQWVQATFNAQTPVAIPADTLLRLYATGINNGDAMVVDELMVIPDEQPVNGSQLRLSYVENPTAFDGVTGLIQVPSNGEPILDTFIYRDVLYVGTTRHLYAIKDNGSTEPSGWSVEEVSAKVGSVSPRATSTGESCAFVLAKSGVYQLTGSVPEKISAEIDPTWASINWSASKLIWSVNDTEDTRSLYIGIPTGTNTFCDTLLVMNYRGLDEDELVPPIHNSMTGREIATDSVRKWTIWTVPTNAGALIERPNGATKVSFAGRNHKNLYSLDPARLSDDDYGLIPAYYITAFLLDTDGEQQFQTGSHRKLITYLTANVSGVGNLKITPYVDDLSNPVRVPRQLALQSKPRFDYEVGTNIVGERVAFKIEALPTGGTDSNFKLTKMVLTIAPDQFSPIAGRL